MDKLSVRIRESCDSNQFHIRLYQGKKHLGRGYFKRKHNAINYAKRMAKLLHVKYDPKISKEHGC